jgi:hypothetical protein
MQFCTLQDKVLILNIINIAAAWDSDNNVFGTDDHTGWFAVSAVISVDNVISVSGSALISDGGGAEELHIWFRETAANLFGATVGAGIAQCDDDLADAVTKRVYSFHTTQGAIISGTMNSKTNEWPGNRGVADTALAMVRFGGSWISLTTPFTIAGAVANLTSPTGKRASMRRHVVVSGDYFGWKRNARVTADQLDGTPTDDAAGTPNGYVVSSGTATATDSMAFRTGAP